MHRGDQYALEELQSSDRSAQEQSDEIQFNAITRDKSTRRSEYRAAVTSPGFAPGENNIARASLDGRMSLEQSPKGGILKTTQLIVSSTAVD